LDALYAGRPSATTRGVLFRGTLSSHFLVVHFDATIHLVRHDANSTHS
jgi:hypothetical protein